MKKIGIVTLYGNYAGAEETLSCERERILDYLRQALADSDEP